MKTFLPFVAALVAGLVLPRAQAQQALTAPPVHRYTFDNASGSLADGSPLVDSAGTATGTVRGAGATATGTGVQLPGGSQTTAAYLDFPNGVASGTDQGAGYASATYETWITVHSAQNWSRVFDFGTNTTGEITAPGGTFTGANYLMVSANIGTALNMRLDRLTGGSQDAIGATVLNTRMHVVATYDASIGAWRLYKDGVLLKTVITANGPNTIPDVNVWLGRSNWSGDSNVNATYDEFRIYDYALSDQQILGNTQAGPNTVTSQSSGLTIMVDPATTVTAGAGNFATEWNTAANFENWTLTQATATVSGGTLQGTTTGTDSRVSLSNFASGPDLDLGWNDFLELRIQVPASYTGPIQLFFGTTPYTIATANGGTTTSATTGFNSSRVITIPSSSIPKDGAFHTYRIDLGLLPLWRATLRDLRIDPLDGVGTSGMTFAIDYVRVGDEPNAAVYLPRYSSECPATGGSTPAGATYGGGQAVLAMESKHFRFMWNAGVEAHGSWNAGIPRGTLRNLEEIWQLYVKKLGYVPPNAVIGNPSGTKYKMNMISWYTGYWAGVNEGHAYSNITPDGLRVDPPSLVLPHEGMHCFQFHTTSGNVPGEWFEFHANYGRELYLDHYRAIFPNASGIDPTYLRCAHQTIEDGRDYYLTWPIFVYLDENPDALPDLGPGTVAKLWSSTQAGEYSLMALERLTPTTSIKDIAGYFARRGATYDYSNQAGIVASLARFGAPLDNAATARWQFTDLVQRPDDSTWWRVPYEMAPMQGAYAIHELVPAGSGAGRVLTVNLRGLADSARGADWRASFIVIADDGTERYSSLWGGGNNSVTLAANENKVYLSVAGAPATFYYGGTDDTVYPYRSHVSKARFPYEIQVTGGTPKQRDNGGTAGLTQHSNGGGWRSVSVPTSVFIGPNARVLGGTVSGNARIEDYAVVSGGTVNSNAVISGHAWVRGGTVTGNAKVRDWALVEGGTVTGNARILEHGNFKGGTAQDLATAKGSAASLTGI